MWVFCKNDLVKYKKQDFLLKQIEKFRQINVNALTFNVSSVEQILTQTISTHLVSDPK